MSLEEYKYGTTFPVVIESTVDKSETAWAGPLRTKEKAPNKLFLVLEDTGFV
jgi:arylsulfatase